MANPKKDEFTQAYNRLKDIHQELSTSDIVDIDKLLVLQDEAKKLYEYLQNRLATLPEAHDMTDNTSA